MFIDYVVSDFKLETCLTEKELFNMGHNLSDGTKACVECKRVTDIPYFDCRCLSLDPTNATITLRMFRGGDTGRCLETGEVVW
jgi:hypothetical protein